MSRTSRADLSGGVFCRPIPQSSSRDPRRKGQLAPLYRTGWTAARKMRVAGAPVYWESCRCIATADSPAQVDASPIALSHPPGRSVERSQKHFVEEASRLGPSQPNPSPRNPAPERHSPAEVDARLPECNAERNRRRNTAALRFLGSPIRDGVSRPACLQACA